MAEYIDRQGFIEDIQTEIINLSMDGMKGTRMPHDELYQFIERIKEQPAADVVPVVHGAPVRKIRPSKHEWYEEVKTENGEILYRKHVYVDETNWSEYCPACGKILCSRFKSYCPNCGAKMDLEESK